MYLNRSARRACKHYTHSHGSLLLSTFIFWKVLCGPHSAVSPKVTHACHLLWLSGCRYTVGITTITSNLCLQLWGANSRPCGILYHSITEQHPDPHFFSFYISSYFVVRAGLPPASAAKITGGCHHAQLTFLKLLATLGSSLGRLNSVRWPLRNTGKVITSRF